MAVRRPVEPRVALECIRNAERPERSLERRLPALERGADDADLLGCHAGADQRKQFLADELECAALARAFEKPNRPVDRRCGRTRLGEESALEMRKRRLHDLVEGRLELLDATISKAGEIFHRPAKRGERSTARLIWHRDGHFASAGERLQQRPFRAGQILEAVREDRLAVPSVELVGYSLSCMAS